MNVVIDASNKPTIEKLLKKVGTDLDTANKQKYNHMPKLIKIQF